MLATLGRKPFSLTAFCLSQSSETRRLGSGELRKTRPTETWISFKERSVLCFCFIGAKHRSHLSWAQGSNRRGPFYWHDAISLPLPPAGGGPSGGSGGGIGSSHGNGCDRDGSELLILGGRGGASTWRSVQTVTEPESTVGVRLSSPTPSQMTFNMTHKPWDFYLYEDFHRHYVSPS